MSAPSRPLRFVVTGSECTGKTTLARQLATRFRLPYVAESAREQAEEVAREQRRELTAADVEPIARRHLAAEARAFAAAAPAVIFDADLLSTVVYARHYYGACPPWIEREARARLGDLYLLHHPDVPWVADGVRDRPDRRAEIHARFAARLDAWSAPRIDVRGDWRARLETAAIAVAERLAAGGVAIRP